MHSNPMHNNPLYATSQSCGTNTNYAEPKRQPAVPMVTENVGYAINELEAVIGDLFNRLTPALRVEPAGKESGGNTSLSFATPLADSLQTHVNRINYLTTAVNSIVGRLEL